MTEARSEEAGRIRAAIVGAGTIGRSMALLFAAAGHPVSLYDPDATQRANAPDLIGRSLTDLASFGLLEQKASEVLSRIRCSNSVEDAVSEAEFIHECGPEKREVKQAIFERLDSCASAEAIIASASSAMSISSFAGHLSISSRCLIAHPANPPFLLRVIELVPAPFTSDETLQKARLILEGVGLRTILVRKEIEGFVFNRLQGAVLREAYCLVRDGVVSVEEIDQLVRDGLGLRWSVVGPFETVDLNTVGGIEEHARRLGPAYARMGAERGQNDPWTSDLVEEVVAQRRAALPIVDWPARVAWRDRQIMAALAGRSRPSKTQVEDVS